MNVVIFGFLGKELRQIHFLMDADSSHSAPSAFTTSVLESSHASAHSID